LVREHSKVTQEAQDVLSKTHPDPNTALRREEYLAALGLARISRMESLVEAIFEHLEKDGASYVVASQALAALLR